MNRVLRPFLLIIRHPWRVAACGLLLAMLTFCVTAIQIFLYSKTTSTMQADAAIVLGAAVWGNRPSPVYRERLEEALALYKNHRVRYLVFTGGTPELGYPSEGEVGQRFALRQGVPASAILYEEASHSTWQNLSNAQLLLSPLHAQWVLLVSDPLHMRRAVAMAEELGLHAAPSPTPSSRFHSILTRGKFLWRETWLYLGYTLWGLHSND